MQLLYHKIDSRSAPAVFLSTNTIHTLPSLLLPSIFLFCIPAIVFCLPAPISFPRLGQKVVQIKNYLCRFTTWRRTAARHAEKRLGLQYPRWQEIFIWFSSPEQLFIPNRTSSSPSVKVMVWSAFFMPVPEVYGYRRVWKVSPHEFDCFENMHLSE